MVGTFYNNPLNQACAARGDIIVGNAGGTLTTVSAGAAAKVLTSAGAGTLPTWETPVTGASTFTAEDASTCAPAAGVLTIAGTATNGISTTAAGSTMTIAMASPYSAGDFTFTTATAGATRALTISNTDNTAAFGAAVLNLSVGGTTNTGDPYVHWGVIGGAEYSMGIDNSTTDDWLKITDGADSSTGNILFSVGGGYALLGSESMAVQAHIGNAHADAHFHITGGLNNDSSVRTNGSPLYIGAVGGALYLGTSTAASSLHLLTGTGSFTITTGTQTTVGAAGGASALPATPNGYLKLYINSNPCVIPYYALS